MSIPAKRFKVLDNETNVAVADYINIFTNDIYNAPNADEIYNDDLVNQIDNIISNELLEKLKDSLLSQSILDPSKINNIIKNILNDPSMKDSIKAAIEFFNIDESNYDQAVSELIKNLGDKYLSDANNICRSSSFLNSIERSLRSTFKAQMATNLQNSNLAKKPTQTTCPIFIDNKPSVISPIKPIDPIDLKPIKINPTITLKKLDSVSVKQIYEPRYDNAKSVWQSSDSVDYLQFVYSQFREKEIIYVNKILTYRAIYYKYEFTVNPIYNPNIVDFDLMQANDYINNNQADELRSYIIQSNATWHMLNSVSFTINTRSVHNLVSPELLDVKADIDNYLLTSQLKVSRDVYFVHLRRYASLMKEYVVNPIYYNIIKKYKDYVLSNFDEQSKNYYMHVYNLYPYYKDIIYDLDVETLNNEELESKYDIIVKDAPDTLTVLEKNILIDYIPYDLLNIYVTNTAPTSSDFLYVAI